MLHQSIHCVKKHVRMLIESIFHNFQTFLPMLKIYTLISLVSKLEFGFFNYIVIFLSAMIFTAVFSDLSSITFTLPVMECDIKLSAFEKGFLGAAFFAGVIASSHLWGYFSDTAGRRCTVLPTLLMAFFSSCFASLSPNFIFLFLFRFINGFW